MPYGLSDDGLCVINKATGETVKCHDTHEKALDHQRALVMNVGDAKMAKNRASKVGARHSAGDQDHIQQAHDHLAKAGAMCGEAGKSATDPKLVLTTLRARKDAGYAISEAYDIQQAASALYALSELAAGEAAQMEPDDVAELADLMRGLAAFINGEIDEMAEAAAEPEPEPAMAYMSARTPTKAAPLNFNYIKSLRLSHDEQWFKDVAAVKSIGKDEIQGYLALWGNPDLTDIETEFFLPQTDFWDKSLGLPRPLTWNHGQDNGSKYVPFKGATEIVGDILEFGDDDVGRFYRAVRHRNHKYRAAIDQLISERALGTSSDSAPQYVQREQRGKAVWLKQWPLFAAALTDIPCEPRMLDVGSPFWKSISVNFHLPGQAGPDGPSVESMLKQLELDKLQLEVSE